MLKQQIAITHKNFQLYHSGFEMNSKAFGKIRNVLNQKPLSRSQRASATRMSASRPVAVKSVESLGFPFQTSDPFLFCVYHKDMYPEGDESMQAPREGNGMDFNFDAPYRMYHGKRVPGFPQHPHRGFETLTATMEGFVDHTDSMGSAGRYGLGDLQWMTAGKGVVHGEMFPLVNKDKPNTLRLFQIWLNLPAKCKMAEPAFVMHWAEQIPKIKEDDGRVEVTVWAGEIGGAKGLRPPQDSWAAEQNNSDVAVWLIEMKPGGKIVLPAAASGASAKRNLYHYEGGEGLMVAGKPLPLLHKAEVAAELPVELHNTSQSLSVGVLMLQGKPIGEPVAKHGPFVMNTRAEIAKAFQDYSETQFGGWPWDADAPIFPRDKGRFALSGGKEERPPSTSA